MKKYIAIALLTLSAACSSPGDNENVSSVSRIEIEKASPVSIERLDEFISSFGELSPKIRQEGIDSLRPGLELMWMLANRGTAGGDLTAEAVSEMAGSRAFRVFTPDIAERFTAGDSVAAVLGVFAANLRKQLPALSFPRLYGTVVSYNQGIVNMGDSVMLIGLNHYLGSDYPGYSNFPDWQRARKTQKYLPIDVAEAVISTQTPAPADATALSRMIHSGAILAAMLRTMPSIDAATALGLSSEQWKWLEQNESQIWQKLISDNLLYCTDPAVARRLTAPGPSTSLLHPDAPPCAGVYIGWRIVEEFMAHTDDDSKQTVSYILSSEFAAARPQSILSAAAYSPGKTQR